MYFKGFKFQMVLEVERADGWLFSLFDSGLFGYPLIVFPSTQADKRKRCKEEANDHLDDHRAAELAWNKHKQLNESIIVALFQGQFKSTVQCLVCQQKSRTFETFMYLSLPLASSSRCSLQVRQLSCDLVDAVPTGLEI